jgi:hypothetical protein
MAYGQTFTAFTPNHKFDQLFGSVKYSLIDLEAETLTRHKQHTNFKIE